MLELNKKYTMVLENNLGIIVSRKIKINKIEESKGGYQQEKYLTIYYTIKGKRKMIGSKFRDNSLFIIDGWEDIQGINDTEMICFDREKFSSILNRYKPVLKYNC